MSKQSDNIKNDVLLIIFISLTPIKWGLQYYYRERWPEWLSVLFFFFMYLIVASLIVNEKDDLADNHIDKISFFVTIFFGAFLRPVSANNHWLTLVINVVFLIIGIMLLFIWLKHKSMSPIHQKLVVWSVVALLASVIEYLSVSYILKGAISGFNLSNFTSFLYFANYELSNVVLPEELFFRGFLWQGLRKRGYSDKVILLTQAVLFTLGHINVSQPRAVVGYLSVIFGGLITGIFAWKSKSVFPGIIIHTIHNTMDHIF